MTEKLLTYALGRGLDYNDVDAVDQIVDAAGSRGGAIFRPAPGSDRIGAISEAAERFHREHRVERVSRTQSSGTSQSHETRPFANRLGRAAGTRRGAAAAHSCAARALRWPFPPLNRCCPRGAGRRRRTTPANWRRRRRALRLRMAFVYVPNGVHQGYWWPKKEGKEFELNRTLQPLEKVKQQLQILGGLDQINADRRA